MKVYNYSGELNEFTYESIADESPLEPGIYLIPALATSVPPPATGKNEAAVFDAAKNQWAIVPDFRIVNLWSKDTAGQVHAGLGEQPEDINATQVEPTVDYPVWNSASGAWVTDEAEKLSTQTAAAASIVQQLLFTANDKIAPLQDAVDLCIATPAETTSLTAWKTYRVAVNRVPTQPGYPTYIDWPPMPE